MDCSCMELALEGERLCKAGDCQTGVQFFEAAVQAGTDDLKTLSAIYSQLGNAYFYLQEYGKALDYHKLDITLARTLGDMIGEAKASGNLGNTLKVLQKFDEAIACCNRHLEISRQLSDKVGEARALYNLEQNEIKEYSSVRQQPNNTPKTKTYKRDFIVGSLNVCSFNTKSSLEVKDQINFSNIIFSIYKNANMSEIKYQHLIISPPGDEKEYDKALGYHKLDLTLASQVSQECDKALDYHNLDLTLARYARSMARHWITTNYISFWPGKSGVWQGTGLPQIRSHFSQVSQLYGKALHYHKLDLTLAS
ncbi:G-protein signaling modulator 2 [Mytilus galloprovincialis]|uniref:G-protein signaling modulator 2 n=1 Tax=Mytilus galloprovincialis TaxID=29158 RepID=A0A8B6HPP6_MYTGA|nr:G-protein signaling modulator 2 [Mytilus galloprovincialis]